MSIRVYDVRDGESLCLLMPSMSRLLDIGGFGEFSDSVGVRYHLLWQLLPSIGLGEPYLSTPTICRLAWVEFSSQSVCHCLSVCLFVGSIRAESVSVFGIFVGIFFHVGSVFGIGISEILVENRKFLVPHLYLAPLLRVTPSEFHRKLEWWGHQAMKKFDSKFGHFDTSTWQTDKQTDTARQQRPFYIDCVAVNIYAFSY